MTQISSADRIFYTMVLNNQTDNDIPVIFQEETTKYILPGKTSDWDCCVMRYSIPLSNIPLMFFKNGVDKISMEYNGFIFTSNLTYVDRSPGITTPLINGYSPIYQLSQYQEMINNAIHTAFVGLGTLTALPSADEPSIIYDKITERWTFSVVRTFYEDTVPIAGRIILRINRKVYNNIVGIDCIYDGTSNAEFSVLFHNNKNNIVGTVISNTQQCDSFANLIDFSSILVTTNLPMQSEYIKDGIGYNIMTDFISLDAKASNFQSPLVYSTIVPYKQAQLQSDSQLNSIIMSVYYATSYGFMLPLMMYPGTHAELKLMFQKRTKAKY